MKIIDPKTLEEWDREFEELTELIDRLPDVPEVEFNQTEHDLLYLEDQLSLFDSVDREYSVAAMFAESLKSKMLYWENLEEAKARDKTLQMIELYPNEKDRNSKIKLLIDDYTYRLRAARLIKSTIDAQKRLLQRQRESLIETINIEKKIKY